MGNVCLYGKNRLCNGENNTNKTVDEPSDTARFIVALAEIGRCYTVSHSTISKL